MHTTPQGCCLPHGLALIVFVAVLAGCSSATEVAAQSQPADEPTVEPVETTTQAVEPTAQAPTSEPDTEPYEDDGGDDDDRESSVAFTEDELSADPDN